MCLGAEMTKYIYLFLRYSHISILNKAHKSFFAMLKHETF